MSALAKLKLIASKRQPTVDPVAQRRMKLAAKIDEQVEMAAARRDGRVYAPKVSKVVTDAETGESRTIAATKRVKEWYWQTEGGKFNLSVRYGSKVLELAKGKNAIEVGTVAELVDTLGVIKAAVMAGELDDMIASASEKLRAGFGK